MNKKGKEMRFEDENYGILGDNSVGNCKIITENVKKVSIIYLHFYPCEKTFTGTEMKGA